MVRELEGNLIGTGLRFGIVVSRFNDFITRPLLEGALGALRMHGVDEKEIEVAWVPGAFEIPLIAQKMASSGKYQAVIALGAVIRGATPHFEYVSGEVAKGVATVSLKTGIPILFGVLTTDTVEQAIERAGTKVGNKGWEAALAAIEMARLCRLFENESVG